MTLNPDLAADLKRRVSGEVRLDRASRILYSTDASIYQIEPLGVVVPRTTDDLQAVVELAARHGVPIVPRGAGTSLAGQAIGEGIILDCSRWLDRIIEIDDEQRTARVQPGVVLSDLNKAAREKGLEFGPDPASAERATMGGVIANNAAGAHSILHGMAADHIVAAGVILSDGSIAEWGEVSATDDPKARPAVAATADGDRNGEFHRLANEIRLHHSQAIKTHFPRTWRNSAGYRINYLIPWAPGAPAGWPTHTYPPAPSGAVFNMAQMLAGSEGTLAVIREATVRLVPRPKHTVLGILTFQDLSSACDALLEILEAGPSAVELVPDLILEAARRVPGYASQLHWLRGSPGAILIVEFSGDEEGELSARAAALRADVQVIVSPEEQAMVWATRKAGLGLLDASPGPSRSISFIEDCAIPVDRLGSFVREIQKLLDAHDARGGIYGHASAGCLHVRPMLDLKTEGGTRSLRFIAEETAHLALRLGGAMSSEHGDGIARGEWLRQTYGDELFDAMSALKRAADPLGILNPRKMLEAPPMDSHLRYGPAYRSKAWSTGIDFSGRGGLGTAIEQCNGQGVCRKETGLMCPSYQGTREEMHSTRGRANLLRALIASGNRAAGTTDRPRALESAVLEALDLCLGCKGCKAECPSGVDMARLKASFLEQYHRGHMRPARDYLFGYFADAARTLAALRPIAESILRFPLLGKMVVRSLRIAPERPLPSFRRRVGTSLDSGGDASVLYLRDPYSHYVDHAAERAALALLKRFGYRVRILETMATGAALISKGFLDSARRHAHKLVAELGIVDPGGSLPLAVLEPSELSAIREDYGGLLRGVDASKKARLASALSVEELLSHTEPPADLSSTLSGKRVLFHPHCHEQSGVSHPAGANHAAVELLRTCGYQVGLSDAGCCGMGGMFGYEAEHYELSQKIGALRLFPAVERESGAFLAATGGSCRLHITQGTGRKAEHPLVLAATALGLT